MPIRFGRGGLHGGGGFHAFHPMIRFGGDCGSGGCHPALFRAGYSPYHPVFMPCSSGECFTPVTQGDQINIDQLMQYLRPLLQYLMRNPRIRAALQQLGIGRTLSDGLPPHRQGTTLTRFDPTHWAVTDHQGTGHIVQARIGNDIYVPVDTAHPPTPGQVVQWRVTHLGPPQRQETVTGRIMFNPVTRQLSFERVTNPTDTPVPPGWTGVAGHPGRFRRNYPGGNWAEREGQRVVRAHIGTATYEALAAQPGSGATWYIRTRPGTTPGSPPVREIVRGNITAGDSAVTIQLVTPTGSDGPQPVLNPDGSYTFNYPGIGPSTGRITYNPNHTIRHAEVGGVIYTPSTTVPGTFNTSSGETSVPGHFSFTPTSIRFARETPPLPTIAAPQPTVRELDNGHVEYTFANRDSAIWDSDDEDAEVVSVTTADGTTYVRIPGPTERYGVTHSDGRPDEVVEGHFDIFQNRLRFTPRTT
jgi:hypothetical protein